MINPLKDGSIPSKRRGSTATEPARFDQGKQKILRVCKFALSLVGRYDSGGAASVALTLRPYTAD